MLDKTKEPEAAPVTEHDLGVGVQYVANLGGNRQLTITASFPQDWPQEKFNGLLDRLAAAAERQAQKAHVETLERTLEGFKDQLFTNRQNLANLEQRYQADWELSKKHGPARLTLSQEQQVKNFKTSDTGLVDKIKQTEKELESAKKKCL
jgi:hypothetical protein